MKRAFLVSVMTLGLLPATANADTFCVHGPCTSGPQTHATLAAALSDANANGSAIRDRIEIGSGVLADTNVTVAVNNPVDIVGAGRGVTTLASASGTTNYVVELNSTSTISDVGIRLAAGANRFGLRLPGAQAERVAIDGISQAPTSPIGINVEAGGVVRDSVSAVTNVPGSTAVVATAGSGQTTTLDNVDLSGSTGLEASPAGMVVARRAVVHDSTVGVYMRGSGIMNLRDDLIRVAGNSSRAVLTGTGPTASPLLNARHVTLVGDASSTSVGFVAVGSNSNQSATANLRDSIVRGFADSLAASNNGGTGAVNVSYSDYDPGSVSVSGGGTVTPFAGNMNVDPLFTNAGGGDFSLSAASPLIDAGDPSAPSATEEPTDVAGKARVTDGNGDGAAGSDMGAFEYQRPAPVPALKPVAPITPLTPAKDVVAPALSSVGLSASTFRVASESTAIAAAKKKAPTGTTLKYKLSEAATVKIAVEQRTTGARITSKGKRVCAKRTKARRKAAKCTRYVGVRTLTRAGKPGANSVAFSGRIAAKALRSGRYRLRLTATDPAGNRSTDRSIGFRIVR